jgi:hypothetical protein
MTYFFSTLLFRSFSWTMMLHGRDAYAKFGMNFLTVRAVCGEYTYPSTPEYPSHMDKDGIPIHKMVGLRGIVGLSMWPRQLPRIAHQASKLVERSCPSERALAMYGSMFIAADRGAYHRLVDPQQDLRRTHKALIDRTLWELVAGTVLDKAPAEEEFMLRNIGDIWNSHPMPAKQRKTDDMWYYIVDRLECLASDPIRLYANAFEIVALETPNKLFLRVCEDLEQTRCAEKILKTNEPVRIPPTAVVRIFTDQEPKENGCRSSSENVVLKVRTGEPWNPFPTNPSPQYIQELNHKSNWADTPELTQLRDLLYNDRELEFQNLVKSNIRLAHMRSADGRGPMWWAVEFNRPSSLQFLLNLGVTHQHEKDSYGLTPPDLLNELERKNQQNPVHQQAMPERKTHTVADEF